MHRERHAGIRKHGTIDTVAIQCPFGGYVKPELRTTLLPLVTEQCPSDGRITKVYARGILRCTQRKTLSGYPSSYRVDGSGVIAATYPHEKPTTLHIHSVNGTRDCVNLK